MARQIKSKSRVSKYGEVYTAEREVNAMLDLICDESYRIESTFFEPACGNGNFLSAILSRKLITVKQIYGESSYNYELHAIQSVSCIYGADIQADNVQECRKRLFLQFCQAFEICFGNEASDSGKEAIGYILSQNIVCGNSLTNTMKNGLPLRFPEWTLRADGCFARRNFLLTELIDYNGEIDDNRPAITYTWMNNQMWG